MLLSGQELDAKTFRVGRPHLGIRKGRLAAYQVTLRNQTMYLFFRTTSNRSNSKNYNNRPRSTNNKCSRSTITKNFYESS